MYVCMLMYVNVCMYVCMLMYVCMYVCNVLYVLYVMYVCMYHVYIYVHVLHCSYNYRRPGPLFLGFQTLQVLKVLQLHTLAAHIAVDVVAIRIICFLSIFLSYYSGDLPCPDGISLYQTELT